MQKYSQFARLLKQVLTRNQGLKSIIMSQHSDPNFVRQAYSILIKAVKHWDQLDDIVNTIETKEHTSLANRHLFVVLMLEMCNPSNTRKKIGGAISTLIKRNRPLIDKLLLQYEVFNEDHLNKRVSLRLIDETKLSIPSHPDPHIPDLVWVEYGHYSQMLRDEVATNGYVVQSKPSCIPAYLLLRCLADRTELQFDVVDCCAAPGNKTLQLAEFMKRHNVRGRVFAFEKSAKRFLTLTARMAQYGFDGVVQCFNRDFLALNPQHPKYGRVRFVLLDPSCSGSGMKQQSLVQRDESTPEMVQSLASMQGALLHQCTLFPKVLRIVYSTCSIYREENEDVVTNFLQSHPTWRSLRAFPEWTTRGLEQRDSIRFSDEGEGFFVAMFRKQ